ncbi:MAG: 30S ribosomal protein S12 methylthiotransferase RimO [Wolinella sp.]
MKSKLHLISLGCTKNLVDSEVMLGRLQEYKLTPNLEEADVIIVNTCGFIEAAKKESLQTIFEALEHRKKGAILVASGCLSERYREELLSELPEIDIITGVGDYDKIDEMIAKKKGFHSGEVFLANESNHRIITGSSVHAYVKLSEGCNQTCSFCAIPQFKGKLHSRTLESTLKEVKNLIMQGFRDFSFIAQDSSSYLRDHGEKEGLIKLVEALDTIDGINSARILYLYPSTASAKLIDTIAKSHVVQNYFDMPIQHIAEPMLKRMKRGANRKRHEELLHRMRSVPDSFLRTTLIIGHPQESEEEFEELCKFMEEFAFDRVNLFAYSDEDGTSAHKMAGKLEKKVINARIKRLDKILQKQNKNLLKAMIGRDIPIILEGKSNEHEFFYSARDMRWAPEIDGEILINETLIKSPTPGHYLAKITDVAGKHLLATLTKKLS